MKFLSSSAIHFLALQVSIPIWWSAGPAAAAPSTLRGGRDLVEVPIFENPLDPVDAALQLFKPVAEPQADLYLGGKQEVFTQLGDVFATARTQFGPQFNALESAVVQQAQDRLSPALEKVMNVISDVICPPLTKFREVTTANSLLFVYSYSHPTFGSKDFG